MPILTLPLVPAPQKSKFGLESNTGVFQSIFTKSTQTAEWPGARWRMTLTMPPMRYQTAMAWKVFLLALRGQAGRFYGYDPDYAIKGPSGTAVGAGKVKGADQVGGSLLTDGWAPDQAILFVAGDQIAFDTPDGRELHMVMAPVASNGAGEATILLEPPIRTSPNNGADIIVDKPSCIMALDNPLVEWDSDQMMTHSFSISATETFR